MDAKTIVARADALGLRIANDPPTRNDLAEAARFLGIKDWDESKHPRDEDGKWTDSGDEGESGSDENGGGELPFPKDSTSTCAIHSIAHVTGKTVQQVWAIAQKYWKEGFGMNAGHIAATLSDLGYTHGKMRLDLTFHPREPGSDYKRLSLGELKTKLTQEPKEKAFLIDAKYYGEMHSMAYRNGKLVDTASWPNNVKISSVYEIDKEEKTKNIIFSRKLEWIARDGQLILRRAKVDKRSGRITIYQDAVRAQTPAAKFEAVLARLVEHCKIKREWDESEHPRDEDGKWTDAGGDAGGGGEEDGGFGFSHTEKAAFGKYIDDSTDLNKYYRNGQSGDQKFDATIDAINSALKKSATSTDAIVWRGISECKVARDLRKNAETLIGQTVPLGGFQSTSISEDIALEFVAGYSSQVIMEIKTPAGTHMIDMSPFADNFAKQKEYLLGEGSFTIESVQRNGRGPLYITGTFKEK